MIYSSNNKKTRVSIVDLVSCDVEKIGDITKKGSLPDHGRGGSGGGIAERKAGGAHVVYSAGRQHIIVSLRMADYQ